MVNLMKTKNVLFIVERNNDEPQHPGQHFDTIQKHTTSFFYHFNNALQSTLLCFFMPVRQERKTK